MTIQQIDQTINKLKNDIEILRSRPKIIVVGYEIQFDDLDVMALIDAKRKRLVTLRVERLHVQKESKNGNG